MLAKKGGYSPRQVCKTVLKMGNCQNAEIFDSSRGSDENHCRFTAVSRKATVATRSVACNKKTPNRQVPSHVDDGKKPLGLSNRTKYKHLGCPCPVNVTKRPPFDGTGASLTRPISPVRAIKRRQKPGFCRHCAAAPPARQQIVMAPTRWYIKNQIKTNAYSLFFSRDNPRTHWCAWPSPTLKAQ